MGHTPESRVLISYPQSDPAPILSSSYSSVLPEPLDDQLPAPYRRRAKRVAEQPETGQQHLHLWFDVALAFAFLVSSSICFWI